ncbi:MAG TPA: cupin domain-containing protein [Thermoleophilaceae bacterium]|jgi:mannose-6-phosphate isomerase-like protein (cupin superfamily)
MRYLRAVDFNAFKGEGYEYQMMYVGESCRVIASHVAAGGAAPAQHIHEVDQLYYITDGEMNVVLGSERFSAGPDTVVFIPAGTPHHNYNTGTEHEFHFEVLAPGPNPNYQPWREVDSADAGDRPYFVKKLEDVAKESLAECDRWTMVSRADGAENMILYVVTVPPGVGAAQLHVRTVDQFCYVLDGELHVEVALETHVARRHELLVLPAGVPHRMWNAGSEPVRHLGLVAPSREVAPGEREDIPVRFGVAA